MTNPPERIWAWVTLNHVGYWDTSGTIGAEYTLTSTVKAKLEAADKLEAAFIKGMAHLLAATSAYKTFAKRHVSQGSAETDALYSTRLKDFESASDEARKALAAWEATKENNHGN